MQHRQLTTAVENLKNIFLGPQIVRESLDFIKQGVLLQAPRNLRDLKQGCPWDELMHKHHHVDMTLIHSSFRRKQGISVELAKQLWMMLQKSLATVPVTPFCWSLLSGSGKERKNGAYLTKKKKMQTSFVLPRRSKNWKEEMFPKSRLIGKDPDAGKD